MRKTLLYLLLLAVLAFGVYYFIFSNKGSDFSKSEAGFTIKDTSEIGKIFLSNPAGDNILLERTDSGWMVNKQYKALNSTLKTLMTAMCLQVPVAPVSEVANDNVIKSMAGNAIKTEVYDRKGKKITVFYVGGEAPGGLGTNMLMEGAKRPYIVQVPGFQGYITSRYNPDLKFWRDRTVFNFAPDQIQRVSVEYPQQPIRSFVINRTGDTSFTVDVDKDLSAGKSVNDRRCRVYLSYFTNINCEGYFNGLNAGVDTVLRSTPKRCVIDVTTKNGKSQHLDIYWMPINKRSKNLTQHNEDVPDDYDADRFFGVMNNNKDTVLIQNYVFSKMFRQGYEFYETDMQGKAPSDKYVQPKNVMIHKNL
jgi:hypothetical protein